MTSIKSQEKIGENMSSPNRKIAEEPAHPDEMRVAESLYAELLRFKYKPPRIKALALALHEAKAQGRREEREELRKLVEEYPWDIKSKGEMLALFAGHSHASDTIKD